MNVLYLSLVSILLYYSKSKYFPLRFGDYNNRLPKWLGFLGLTLVFFCNIKKYGAVNGSLISIVLIPLAACIVPFFLQLPKIYLFLSLGLLHLFLLLNFIY